MTRTIEIINGQPVALVLGQETKLFFKRFAALEAAGVIARSEPVQDLPALAGDKDAFFAQVFLIRDQSGVSLETAIAGALLVKANQQTPWFDPLTLPWLN